MSSTERRDANAWAARVERLAVGKIDPRARNLNVEGRRPTSPLQGFGQLWEKTYTVRLAGADVTPEQLVADWRDGFGGYWPRRNWFNASLERITPGDVAVLNLAIGPFTLATGVLVLYADERQFTVMTPEGHQFAGFNTFSARDENGTTVAEIKALVRGSDPLYELGLVAGIAHTMEDRFWEQTLRNVAARWGVAQPPVAMTRTLVDPRRQWARWRNVRHNALVRSVADAATRPLRRAATRRGPGRGRVAAAVQARRRAM